MFLDEAQVGIEIDSIVVTNLKRAKALIANPGNWTCGTYQRKLGGHVSYCAFGALAAVKGIELYGTPSNLLAALHDECIEGSLLNRAADLLYSSTPVAVNDGFGHSAAMKMFDKAIELAEQD